MDRRVHRTEITRFSKAEQKNKQTLRYSRGMPDSQPRLRMLMRRKLSSGVTSRCTIRLGFFLHRVSRTNAWSVVHEIRHVAEERPIRLVFAFLHITFILQDLPKVRVFIIILICNYSSGYVKEIKNTITFANTVSS